MGDISGMSWVFSGKILGHGTYGIISGSCGDTKGYKTPLAPKLKLPAKTIGQKGI